ncbi:hypothetical protein BDV28DRAFT_128707 [Aspergillus coremiiformis]|uniref:Uncharacterized protein n=1 Tax=Aspergillus coremiiformis TaxID=138285 RepID=A0A5N6ZFJ5_9EURO|nr:hypothetical protein BDV28DRAFT_128707 [Aspergillus coremiiformis]
MILIQPFVRRTVGEKVMLLLPFLFLLLIDAHYNVYVRSRRKGGWFVLFTAQSTLASLYISILTPFLLGIKGGFNHC